MTNVRKALVITHLFPPLDCGVGRQIKLVKYLPTYGWTPIVLAAKKSYLRPIYDPSRIKEIPRSAKIYRTFSLEIVPFQQWMPNMLKRLVGINPKWFQPVDPFIGWIPFALRIALKVVKEEKIDLPQFKDILRTHHINGVRLKILYPPKNFIYKRKKDRWRNRNNNSLVVKAELGSKSFLFPGDIMSGAERELVAIAGDELRSTVLMAPHHGSKTSSTVSFLNKIKPELVIISSGWKNSFRFPHASVLKRYKERGYEVFRTDSHGALTMSTDGKSLIIRPCILDPSCPG